MTSFNLQPCFIPGATRVLPLPFPGLGNLMQRLRSPQSWSLLVCNMMIVQGGGGPWFCKSMCWLGFLVNAPGCEQKLLLVRGLSRDTARTLVISNTCLREGRKGRGNMETEAMEQQPPFLSNIQMLGLLDMAIYFGLENLKWDLYTTASSLEIKRQSKCKGNNRQGVSLHV